MSISSSQLISKTKLIVYFWEFTEFSFKNILLILHNTYSPVLKRSKNKGSNVNFIYIIRREKLHLILVSKSTGTVIVMQNTA